MLQFPFGVYIYLSLMRPHLWELIFCLIKHCIFMYVHVRKCPFFGFWLMNCLLVLFVMMCISLISKFNRLKSLLLLNVCSLRTRLVQCQKTYQLFLSAGTAISTFNIFAQLKHHGERHTLIKINGYMQWRNEAKTLVQS